MAYQRPDVLSTGDLVPAAHFKRLRGNWIAYENHDHGGGTGSGAEIEVYSPVYGAAFTAPLTTVLL